MQQREEIAPVQGEPVVCGTAIAIEDLFSSTVTVMPVKYCTLHHVLSHVFMTYRAGQSQRTRRR